MRKPLFREYFYNQEVKLADIGLYSLEQVE